VDFVQHLDGSARRVRADVSVVLHHRARHVANHGLYNLQRYAALSHHGDESVAHIVESYFAETRSLTKLFSTQYPKNIGVGVTS
jgi:hypothetical protein